LAATLDGVSGAGSATGAGSASSAGTYGTLE